MLLYRKKDKPNRNYRFTFNKSLCQTGAEGFCVVETGSELWYIIKGC